MLNIMLRPAESSDAAAVAACLGLCDTCPQVVAATRAVTRAGRCPTSLNKLRQSNCKEVDIRPPHALAPAVMSANSTCLLYCPTGPQQLDACFMDDTGY